MSSNRPFNAIESCTATASPPITLYDPTPAWARGISNVFGVFTQNLSVATPDMNQWSFNIQREIGIMRRLTYNPLARMLYTWTAVFYVNTPLPGLGA